MVRYILLVVTIVFLYPISAFAINPGESVVVETKVPAISINNWVYIDTLTNPGDVLVCIKSKTKYGVLLVHNVMYFNSRGDSMSHGVYYFIENEYIEKWKAINKKNELDKIEKEKKIDGVLDKLGEIIGRHRGRIGR